MKVRRLDPETHEITFGQGLANYAADQAAVAQNVKTRLVLQLAEWYLDDNAGVPYLGEICTKPANLPLVESLIKECILGTYGVKEISAFDMLYDAATRQVSISATVKNAFGTVESIQVDYSK